MPKFCPHCQSPIQEEAAFCSACGTKVASASPEHTQPDARPSGKRTGLLIAGIACILVIFLTVAVLCVFSNKTEEAAPAETPGPTVQSEEKTTPAVVELATPTPSPLPRDTETIIESIRTRYYAAQDEMHTYKIETVGTQTRYYSPDGTLARLDVPSVGGGDSFYYDNGSLYFVFTYSEDGENRFYFDNRQLVRWIPSSKAVYESAEEHRDFVFWESYWLEQSDTHNADVRYRVRPSADDAAGQIGAFAKFENAKKTADANPGCEVYDMYGTLIYTP